MEKKCQVKINTIAVLKTLFNLHRSKKEKRWKEFRKRKAPTKRRVRWQIKLWQHKLRQRRKWPIWWSTRYFPRSYQKMSYLINQREAIFTPIASMKRWKSKKDIQILSCSRPMPISFDLRLTGRNICSRRLQEKSNTIFKTIQVPASTKKQWGRACSQTED